MEPVVSHLMLQTVPVVLELLVRVVRSHRQLVRVVTHHVREHILKHTQGMEKLCRFLYEVRIILGFGDLGLINSTCKFTQPR